MTNHYSVFFLFSSFYLPFTTRLIFVFLPTPLSVCPCHVWPRKQSNAVKTLFCFCPFSEINVDFCNPLSAVKFYSRHRYQQESFPLLSLAVPFKADLGKCEMTLSTDQDHTGEVQGQIQRGWLRCWGHEVGRERSRSREPESVGDELRGLLVVSTSLGRWFRD